MSFRISGSKERSEGPENPIGQRDISSIVSDHSDGGLNWILVDPRVTSRGSPLSPKCLTLRISISPDFGATNEIKIFPKSGSPE